MKKMCKDLGTLMSLAEKKAARIKDGHFTIFRFTTGWKVVFGTPDMPVHQYEEVLWLPKHETMEDALFDLLTRPGNADVREK